MRSLRGVALVVVATVLVVAAQASAGGPTTESYTYTVGSSGVPGVSTGLVLEAGLGVTATATGSVCPFGPWGPCFGPAGNPAWDTKHSSYGGFVLPGAPAWGLVARVGSGPWVQVGTGPTTLSGTGALVFAVNDDLFVDNQGTFIVTVSYTCYPGWGYGDKNHTHCGPPGLDGNTSASSGGGQSSSHAPACAGAQPCGRGPNR
jgi:hypothetical protein